MKRTKKQVSKFLLRFADPFLSALALLFSVSCLTNTEELNTKLFAFATFLTLSISFGIGAIREPSKKSFSFIKDVAFAVIYLASAVLFFAVQDLSQSIPIVVAIYFFTLIINRVESFIKNKWLFLRIANVVMSIVYSFLILSCGVLFGVEDSLPLLVILALFVSFKALGHIIASSFSKMQFGVLMKIIRQTFAGEILFGMFMLIIACSIVLPAWEPNITNYYDGLWYCFAVVTTIGFGDFAAVSSIGRVLTVLLGVYGIIVVALITSIIVNFYNEVKNDKRERFVENTTTADIVAGIEDLVLDQTPDVNDDNPTTKSGNKGKKNK